MCKSITIGITYHKKYKSASKEGYSFVDEICRKFCCSASTATALSQTSKLSADVISRAPLKSVELCWLMPYEDLE